MTKQPSLQYEMVGDALKKPQQSLKGRMQFKCKKRRKKYPERKKSSSYALKKNSGGVKPQWTELPEKGLPLCTWTIKQESDGKPCAPKVSGRGLDCPVSRIESLLLSENPHTWLVLNLLTRNLQSLTQWEVRNHKFCLVGTALSKTASRQPFSDFNLIFCLSLFFLFQLQKLGKLSTDNTKSTWGQIRREAKLT